MQRERERNRDFHIRVCMYETSCPVGFGREAGGRVTLAITEVSEHHIVIVSIPLVSLVTSVPSAPWQTV